MQTRLSHRRVQRALMLSLSLSRILFFFFFLAANTPMDAEFSEFFFFLGFGAPVECHGRLRGQGARLAKPPFARIRHESRTGCDLAAPRHAISKAHELDPCRFFFLSLFLFLLSFPLGLVTIHSSLFYLTLIACVRFSPPLRQPANTAVARLILSRGCFFLSSFEILLLF